MSMSSRRAPLVGAACAVLAACATPTPYQPIGTPGAQGGYYSQRIEPDRFRVSFAGNSLTSRETVERYLLFRAAELTLEQGADWFEVAYRDTDRDRQVIVDRPFGPGYYGWWAPSWRYYRRGLGWRWWHPFHRDPFWGDTYDVRTIDRYEASAEIVLHRGRRPDNPRAYDAREVVANLRGQIQLPQ